MKVVLINSDSFQSGPETIIKLNKTIQLNACYLVITIEQNSLNETVGKKSVEVLEKVKLKIKHIKDFHMFSKI